eukprot:825168-Pyramimonas_sp.AAC.2
MARARELPRLPIPALTKAAGAFASGLGVPIVPRAAAAIRKAAPWGWPGVDRSSTPQQLPPEGRPASRQLFCRSERPGALAYGEVVSNSPQHLCFHSHSTCRYLVLVAHRRATYRLRRTRP